jgi:hypothetical protein
MRNSEYIPDGFIDKKSTQALPNPGASGRLKKRNNGMQSIAQVDGQTATEIHEPRPYALIGAEPALEELLEDPVTHAVMACDRVSIEDLRSLLESTRDALLTRTVRVAA